MKVKQAISQNKNNFGDLTCAFTKLTTLDLKVKVYITVGHTIPPYKIYSKQ